MVNFSTLFKFGRDKKSVDITHDEMIILYKNVSELWEYIHKTIIEQHKIETEIMKLTLDLKFIVERMKNNEGSGSNSNMFNA